MPEKILKKLKDIYQELHNRERTTKRKIEELNRKIRETKAKISQNKELAKKKIIKIIESSYYPKFRHEILEKTRLYMKYKDILNKYDPDKEFIVPYLSLSAFVMLYIVDLLIIFLGGEDDGFLYFMSIFFALGVLWALSEEEDLYDRIPHGNKIFFSLVFFIFYLSGVTFLYDLVTEDGIVSLPYLFILLLIIFPPIEIISLFMLSRSTANKIDAAINEIGYSGWKVIRKINDPIFRDVANNEVPDEYLISLICKNLDKAKELITEHNIKPLENACYDLKKIDIGDVRVILKYTDKNLSEEIKSMEKEINQLKENLKDILLDKEFTTVLLRALELEATSDYSDANKEYNSIKSMLEKQGNNIGNEVWYLSPTHVGGVENAIQIINYVIKLNEALFSVKALYSKDPTKISIELEIATEFFEDITNISKYENIYVDLLSEKIGETRNILKL